MSASTLYELIGYAASALIVVSLAMTSVLRLRIVNLVGAALFTVYGALIGSVPIILTNGVIVGIDVYFLWKALRDREYFRLLEVSPDSSYLRAFLDFHRDDIARFQPDFVGEVPPDRMVLFVLRDLVPAGLFVGRPEGDGVVVAELDYAIPDYRDFKLGRYLYSSGAAWFLDRGVDAVEAHGVTEAHDRYLRQMGFVEDGAGALRLRLEPAQVER